MVHLVSRQGTVDPIDRLVYSRSIDDCTAILVLVQHTSLSFL